MSSRPSPRRQSGRASAAVALAIASLIGAPSAFAADATWIGVTAGGLGAAWINGINWNPAAAPGATSGTANTDIATFNNVGYQAITLPTAENIGGITFATSGSSANPFFLTGGSLLPSAGAVIQTDSTYLGIADINSAITAQGNLTLTANGAAGSGLLIGTTITTAANSGSVTLALNGSNSGYTNYYGDLITGIISQNVTGSTLKLSKSGTGTWFLGAANTYTGGTDLNGGRLTTGNATALGSSGTIAVLGNTTLRTTTALTDPSSRISISDGATLTMDTYNVNQTWAGALGNSGASNTAGLTKTGLGTLTLQTATQTYKGDTTINAGQLLIQGNASTNLINASSRLVLGGGQLDYKGTNLTTSTQTFNGTVLNAGISLFVGNSGTGTNTIDFGAITRTSGSLLNLTTPGGYSLKATGTANDAGGIVKGLFNGNDFQTVNSGTGVIGTATYATANNAANTWTGSTTNIQTNAALTNSTVGTGGTVTLNALKLNGAGSQSFAINGTLAVNDGIIFGSGIGANASEISGGSLTGPSGNTGSSDLIIVNNNAQNTYGRNTISSTIVDNGSATNVILHGAANGGALFISGANTYTGNTYVAGGQNNTAGLVVVGGAAGASIGSSNATVYINGGQGGTNSTLRIGNGDATGDVKGTIQLDNGKLSLNRTDTYTLSASVAGTTGGGYISQDATGGNATINFAAGNNIFTSLVNNAAGTLNLTGVGSVNAFASNLNGFNAGATTNFNSGTYYFASTGNSGSNQAGTLNINGATVIAAGGRYFMSGGGTLTLNSGTFQVNGNAMNGQNQTTGNIAYNINGGQLITTPNTNTGSQSAWQLGGASAGATGSVIATQTAGEVSVGVPANANNPTNTYTGLWIGGAGSIQTSTYNLSGGVLRVVGGIQESGTAGAVGTNGSNNFNWTGGRLTTSSINMNFITSNDGVNSGTGTLFQGGSTSIMAPGETFNGQLYTGKTTITGNYQIDNGAVAIGIGGTTPATVFHDTLNTSTGTYDNISVSGSTVLGGRLSLGLINSYTPTNADTFTVLTSTGVLSGTFNNFQVLNPAGASFSNFTGNGAIASGTSAFNVVITTGAGGTVVANKFIAGNTYDAPSGSLWDAPSSGSWTNYDPGSSTGASGAIAQFADGASTGAGANAVTLNSTRNVQGIEFSSATAGHNYSISGTGAIILDNTANSASATIAGSSASGNSNSISVPITLASNVNVSVTNPGNTLTLGNIAGAGKSLTKSGAGTLVLAGMETYSGPTTISAGTLSLAGSTSSLAGDLVVNAGSLNLNGISTGLLTLAAGKNFALSAGSFGLSFASTSSFDQIAGSGIGTFNITGGTFDLTNTIPDYAFTYNILTGFAPGSVSGLSFTGYNPAYIPAFSNTGQLSFTAVPEPNAPLLLAAGGVALWVFRRRRQMSRHA